MKRLQGQVAIITGGAQGLGEALAERLASEGAHVVVADINLEQATAVAERIGGMPFQTDVTDFAQCASLAQATLAKYGKIDLLVCNAAILIAAGIESFDSAKWKKVIEVNLCGYYNCAKAVAQHMMDNKRGNIIQINSKSGKKGSYKNSAYAASKFGGIGLTQSLALEFAPYGVRVNAICPGNLLDSPLWNEGPNSLFKQYAKNQGLTEEAVREKYLNQVPLHRSCTYEDVGNAMVFLASDEASYMTGQAINITGGQEMR